MTSPQLENGFLRLANEIVDALAAYRIPGEQMQCLLFILRKTYGFGKKEDAISYSQFCDATGLKKPSVCRALNNLFKKKIINKKVNGNIATYSFNKTYSQWASLTKKLTNVPQSSLYGSCYLCGFDRTTEKHHIKPQSEGGNDKVENIIILCPNCHTLVHRGEIKQDLLTIKLMVEKEGNKNGFEPLTKKLPTKDNYTKDNIIPPIIPPADPPPKKKPAKRFTPPSVEDVFAYCQERGNEIDAEYFVDSYTAKDWMIGKNKMKDWKAAVRTWEKNGINRGKGMKATTVHQANMMARDQMAKMLNDEADNETRRKSCGKDLDIHGNQVPSSRIHS